jgi:hypothetical protein
MKERQKGFYNILQIILCCSILEMTYLILGKHFISLMNMV